MAPSLLLRPGFILWHRFTRLALLGLLADRGHSCMLDELDLNGQGLKIRRSSYGKAFYGGGSAFLCL